ncbi:MAG: hypothetical protein NC218_04775 [Acetobacter sp.]|nr:hypothetical protein [Acetobacter sp.]
MLKIIFTALLICGISFNACADASKYIHNFDIQMDMDLSNLDKYILKLKKMARVYDKGYESRFYMEKKFNKEFSRVIKAYGNSESRIKTSYEDDLLQLIQMLPKEMYQYIGPMLHEVPTMPEKILNLPGIKETKNKFPDDIAEKYKGVEDLEYLSPALYVALMPQMWEKSKNLDEPENLPAEKPKKPIRIPDYLKEKVDSPVPQAEMTPASATVKLKPKVKADMSRRTIFPTLTSPLTTKDAEDFIATLDKVNEWGKKNDMKNSLAIIDAGFLLNLMELDKENGLSQNELKDLVNPCQNLILKTRIAGIYDDFRGVVAEEGFTPEEWAYTCDKTFKAFRVAEINHGVAYAIRFHRRGYYNKYIKMLPEKWQKQMFETEAAIIAMYAVLKEDVEAVRPIKGKIRQKILENNELLLTSPIVY